MAWRQGYLGYWFPSMQHAYPHLTPLSCPLHAGMVAATLATLRPGALFAEVGKRDIWSAARVAQERPDLCYRVVAIDFLPISVLHAYLGKLSCLLAVGAVAPPPTLCYSLQDTVAAFRRFTQAQHVGKIVVQVSPGGQSARGPAEQQGSWVISGGLGALGALTAAWLVSHGQRHVVLLGRSGRAADSAATGVMRSSAAQVVALRCDTAMANEAHAAMTCDSLLASTSTLPPVRGVINSGGVLADGIIVAQTSSRVRTVFAPKLASAMAMHSSGRWQPLQQQVLFSSAASLFGAPGQANYAAANAALEGWTAVLSQHGVASTAVQWGAWAAGMAADEAIVQRAKRTGLGLLQPSSGFDALAIIMRTVGSLFNGMMAAVPVDWHTLLKVRLWHPPIYFLLCRLLNLPDTIAKLSLSFPFSLIMWQQGEAPFFYGEFASRSQLDIAAPSATDSAVVPAPARHARRERKGLAGAKEHLGAVPVASLAATVGEVARQILGSDVSTSQPLMEAGLDSLGE
jgi:short-subunit dehydrogenase